MRIYFIFYGLITTMHVPSKYYDIKNLHNSDNMPHVLCDIHMPCTD